MAERVPSGSADFSRTLSSTLPCLGGGVAKHLAAVHQARCVCVCVCACVRVCMWVDACGWVHVRVFACHQIVIAQCRSMCPTFTGGISSIDGGGYSLIRRKTVVTCVS